MYISRTATASATRYRLELVAASLFRYGEEAAIQAGMRADELVAVGDLDGAAT